MSVLTTNTCQQVDSEYKQPLNEWVLMDNNYKV